MNRRRISPLLAAVLTLAATLAAAPAAARAAAPGAPSTTARDADEAALRAALGPRVRVHWPAAAPRPTALHGLDLPLPAAASPTATAADRAHALLRGQAAALHLDGLTFGPGTVRDSGRAVVVRLPQTAAGLPVYQRGATVVLTPDGERVRSVTLSLADIGAADDAQDDAWLPEDAAVAAARAHLRGVPAPDAAPRAVRRLLAGPPARPVWHVTLATLAPAGRVSIFVDAVSGALVWQRRDVIADGPAGAGR